MQLPFFWVFDPDVAAWFSAVEAQGLACVSPVPSHQVFNEQSNNHIIACVFARHNTNRHPRERFSDLDPPGCGTPESVVNDGVFLRPEMGPFEVVLAASADREYKV